MDVNPLIIILGATASGKTRLAVEVAAELNTEIISADSRQIFKRMNLGTGKDLGEYSREGKNIPYHLIDILEPGDRYHVDAFKNDFFKAFQDIQRREKIPILCGGTGMYIHSILMDQSFTSIPVHVQLREQLEWLEKEELISILNTYQNIHPVDQSSKKRLIRGIEVAEYLKNHVLKPVKRPTLHPIVFGLKNETEVTRTKILMRLEDRLNAGMVSEVQQLLEDGVPYETLLFYGLEYKFICLYLNNEIDFSTMKDRLGTAICQYAKRQNTFFRKMEKDGVRINWLDASATINQLKQQVIDIVSN